MGAEGLSERKIKIGRRRHADIAQDDFSWGFLTAVIGPALVQGPGTGPVAIVCAGDIAELCASTSHGDAQLAEKNSKIRGQLSAAVVRRPKKLGRPSLPALAGADAAASGSAAAAGKS
jgi:hypothetical protein